MKRAVPVLGGVALVVLGMLGLHLGIESCLYVLCAGVTLTLFGAFE